ncbi:MAG: aspartate kinase [Bacteroidales bacterium]|nr:aspartate kinase [Bacteroidales bacterium]
MNDIFVEKFGGASVNSAKAVKNVETILKLSEKKRIVVISAMGKTTNHLENLVNNFFNKKDIEEEYFYILNYHTQLIEELFNNLDASTALSKLQELCRELINRLNSLSSTDYNFLYDSIVSFGERISTMIVSEFLNQIGLKNILLSAKDIIKTDNNYRDANIDWIATQHAVEQNLLPLFSCYDTIIVQGFLGGTKEGLFTTLGREGSDYSASILAHCTKALSMTIWKDVPGLLNADPKRIKQTTKLSSVPYREAIELSYYGASIIHPKTIKPIENLSIPLYIKSFVSPLDKGSVICDKQELIPKVTNYIFKDNQILLSISPKDFSFIGEKNIAIIFSILAKNKVKVNLMQNSAISFSLCFDENRNILPQLLDDLQEYYNVKYNISLQLITLRHYTPEAVESVLRNKKILIEQKNRTTAQFLVEDIE